MAIDFRDHLSMDGFVKLVECQQERPEYGSAEYQQWLEQRTALSQMIFHSGMKSFLLALKEQGAVISIANTGTYCTRIGKAWNKVAEALPGLDSLDQYAWETITRPFEKSAYLDHFCGNSINKGLSLKERYEAFVGETNRGDFSSYLIYGGETCSETGVELFLEFKNWHAEYVIRHGDDFTSAPILPKEAPIRHVELEFKTGNLLIADWFHIPEFTEQTKAACDSLVDSKPGLLARTFSYAEKLGFANVFVGDSSPAIFVGEDGLVFGRETDVGPRDPAYEVCGRVGGAVWWATVIEQERLTEIVGKSVGIVKARQMVDDYVAENEVVCLKVNPGIYHLYFDPQYRDFQAGFDTDDMTLPADCGKPFFVLANKSLSIKSICEAEAPGMKP